MKHHFRVIQTYPCPEQIAPFWVMCLQGIKIVSCYRASDADPILHAHGHHDQTEVYEGHEHGDPRFPYPANRPGGSTHEGKSDGVVYPWIPYGEDIPWWGIPVDLADPDQADEVIRQASLRGWRVFQPYKSGSEAHHLNFEAEPGPNTHGRIHITEHRIEVVRNHLPRH